MHEFDAVALFEALDRARVERGLSWRAVAGEIWQQSADLNAQRDDHPISPATLTALPTRGDTSCQHALFMLRWLGDAPEDYLRDGAEHRGPPLPAAGSDRRLRWDYSRLYGALDAKRRADALTWHQLAGVLRCTPNQLTGIRTAMFGLSMRLAMRIVGWLDRPAADFVDAATW